MSAKADVYRLRLKRSARRILRYLCRAIFLRRFLITLPIQSPPSFRYSGRVHTVYHSLYAQTKFHDAHLTPSVPAMSACMNRPGLLIVLYCSC